MLHGCGEGGANAFPFDSHGRQAVPFAVDVHTDGNGAPPTSQERPARRSPRLEARLRAAEARAAELAEALEASRRREEAAAREAESARAESRAAQDLAQGAEAATAALHGDVAAAKAALREALAEWQPEDATTPDASNCAVIPDASIADLVASLLAAYRLQSADRSAAAALPASAAREVLSLGTKLWRLQQAQRAMGTGDFPMSSARELSCRGPRPLYASPQSRQAGDDIASQLLTEMSQALRELEKGIAAAA